MLHEFPHYTTGFSSWGPEADTLVRSETEQGLTLLAEDCAFLLVGPGVQSQGQKTRAAT